LSDDRAIHPTWLILDASSSMAWPEDSLAKWRALCGIAVGLTSIAQQAGDPVGVLIVGKGETGRCPPAARPDVVARLDHLLETTTFGSAESIAGAWRHVPVRSREVLISDLLGSEEESRREVAARVAAGSEVAIIHVVSSRELDPPGDLTLAQDPDSPEIIRPFDEASRAGYRERFLSWQDTTRAAWTAAGARYTRVIAEDDLAHSVRLIVSRLGQQG
jgi:uncharacterized protein (DUF58 family)